VECQLTGTKFTWIGQFLFMFSLMFTKLSVLMFYRRLVAGTFSMRTRLAIWTAMAIAVITTIVFSCLLLAACRPVHSAWMQYDMTWNMAHRDDMWCVDPEKQLLSGRLAGIFSVITDFYTVLLPAIIFMRIQITKRQRWALIFIFGVGYL